MAQPKKECVLYDNGKYNIVTVNDNINSIMITGNSSTGSFQLQGKVSHELDQWDNICCFNKSTCDMTTLLVGNNAWSADVENYSCIRVNNVLGHTKIVARCI